MINVSTYSAADYAAALSKAQEVLEASGFFESVTLNAASNPVTCRKNGSTLATVKLTASTFAVTFTGLMNISETNLATFIIATTNKGVFITFLSSSSVAAGVCFTVLFSESKNGKVMCCYNRGNQRLLTLYAEDTTNSQSGRSSAPVASNSYFSTLAAMCVATGSEDLVSVSDGACLFHDRLSFIPRGAFSTVTIGGDTYLTDGDLCLLDA